MWLVRLSIGDALAAAAGNVTLERRARVGEHFRDIQGATVHAQVVFGVSNRRKQQLLHDGSRRLRRVHQDRKRLVHLLTADQIDDDLHLAGRDAHVTSGRAGTLVRSFLADLRLFTNSGSHAISLLYLRPLALSPA